MAVHEGRKPVPERIDSVRGGIAEVVDIDEDFCFSIELTPDEFRQLPSARPVQISYQPDVEIPVASSKACLQSVTRLTRILEAAG